MNGLNDNTNIGLGLKLSTNRSIQKSDGGMNLIPEKPFLAYLKAPSGVTNVNGYIDKYESDNLSGGMFYVYQFDVKVLDIVEQMLKKKSVSIVFNRKEGGYDITVPIDLIIASVNDEGQRTKSDEGGGTLGFHQITPKSFDLYQYDGHPSSNRPLSCLSLLLSLPPQI